MLLNEHSMQDYEEWRPITGYEGLYEVSSLGNVRSLDREILYTQKNQYGEAISKKRCKGRLLSKRYTKSGYQRVQLSGKDYYIHRLVAQEFIGSICGLEVNHKDGNKANNTVQNLEIVTRYENHDHVILTGLNSTSNLTRRIQVNGVRFNSINEASRELGVSTDTLIRRLNGESINTTSNNYKYDLEVLPW